MAGSDKGRGSPSGNAKSVRTGPRVPVLVVGAGPTGLLLAAELLRRGVRCHLIDARPEPLHWDRATVVHPRSLEIFESLGMIDRFLAVGCRQRSVRIHSAGKVLGTMDLATCGSAYGFNLGLSEEVTESILTDYLHRQGGEVHRSHRLVGLEQESGEVLVDVEDDGEHYRVAARWVVGCDGLHSPTRRLCGIGFEGHDITRPWAVFDATLQGWPEAFDANFVYLETLPVILTALPKRRWRVYTRPSSADSDLVAEASSIIRRYSPHVSVVDVENPTRFQCHTKVATRYRAGAVFLAGDAAHVCSPAEGHGMNCGLQDAFNLAWKIALVQHAGAGPDLLDSYEAERRPVAERIARSGDRMEGIQSMTDRGEREDRDRIIESLLADPTTRQHEIVAEAELNANYGRSPIVTGNVEHPPSPGQRLPDTIQVRWTDGRTCRLRELTHHQGHTLILVGGTSTRGPALAALETTLRTRSADWSFVESNIALGTRADLPEDFGRLEPATVRMLGVEETTLFALRPDHYIGLRSDRDHLNALERYRNLIHAGHS